MNFRLLLRSLSHRNYRLFFAGQGVSLIGTWMQQIAMSWLVFGMTQSSFKLGLVLFCGQVPALVLAPVAGVLTDHWNRHRLLLLTQTLAMVQAFLLAGLVLGKLITVPQIMALSVFLGVVNTFDMTGRQAFLTEMVVNREDLGNAIALNSSIVNGARLIGPSLAGLVLAQTSEGVCFLINGISYLAVLMALLAMRLAPRPPGPAPPPLWQGLHEGFRYVYGFVPIRALLLLLALVSMAGISYNVLLPAFTVEVLHGDASILGLLGAASGVGALTGALFLASRRSVLGLGTWIMVCPSLMGLGLLLLAALAGGIVKSPRGELWLTMAALLLIGFGMMVQMAASNTVLQTIVDEDKRGRVMSFYTMAFLGMAPLGSLLTGYLASVVQPRGALAINGLVCVAGSLLFAFWLPRLREMVRPIYSQMGILPEINAGIDRATRLQRSANE